MKKSTLVIPLLTSCALLLNGCYIWKQGTCLLSYTTHSKPIPRLMKRQDTPDSLKRFFSLVDEIRAFAQDSIGLPKNSNYTNYVSTDRSHLIDVVAATGKTDFIPYQWCYPLFGCWPLRGYFDSTDAIKEAARLRDKGYDVAHGQAGAFSTLGILSDPVYTFMKNYSVYKIANLIIHEQTHTAVYVKNQVDFSEEFASFSGAEGAQRFIRSKYGDSSAQYRRVKDLSGDIKTYHGCIRSLYQTLSALYESGVPLEEKLAHKRDIITRFKDSIAVNYGSMFLTPSFRGLEKEDINNASISLEMTYTLDLDLFYRLYEQEDRDLKRTIAAVKDISKKKGDCRENLKKYLIKQ